MTTLSESTPSSSPIALLLLSTAVAFLFFLVRRRHHKRLPPSPFGGLPIIGHFLLLGPLIHQSFSKLCQRYGPIIYLRLGSVPCVVVSTTDLAREFLKTNELAFSNRKRTLASNHLTYNSSYGFAPYGPYWKFVHKFSQTEFLSARSLRQFLPIRAAELHNFIKIMHEKSVAGQTVDISAELLKMTSNIISQMIMSMRVCGDKKQAVEAGYIVRETAKIVGEFNASDFIWFLKNIDLKGFRKRFVDIHKRYDALAEKIVSEREELRRRKKSRADLIDEEGEAKDFLDLMLDAMEDSDASEIKLTRIHVKALILDFFSAGSSSSAVAIEWALAELINHPKLLERARGEIEAATSNNRLVEESDIRSLPYIQAVIKETLRLHPPIPMVARKSARECVIRGYTIPEGCLLFVNTWHISRDPLVWENPTEFDPGRFLHPDALDIKGQSYELLPFGSGRRGCPGITLAMQELITTLAVMIQCFDWKAYGRDGREVEAVDMDEGSGLVAPRAHHLICKPVARLGPLDKMLGGANKGLVIN